jgi:outer membrane lipoprotein-sorting protein
MVLLAGMVLSSSGCAVSKKHAVPPGQVRAAHEAREATKEELLAEYNQQARTIQTLNATVNLQPTAGSAYSGVIEEYHDVNGFILAAQPSRIRVIGQAPVVGKNIFDMVSDGETFHIYIPSKNKFIVGPTSLERPAKKPIENLRPQHLFDALFWQEIPASAPVLFEESKLPDAWYFILTFLRKSSSGDWEIARKVWYDRADLKVKLIQTYGPGGTLVSDVTYRDWEPAGEAEYPRWIGIMRWNDSYRLNVTITKLALNQPIEDGRFRLEQPAGTELVHVEESAGGAQP